MIPRRHGGKAAPLLFTKPDQAWPVTPGKGVAGGHGLSRSQFDRLVSRETAARQNYVELVTTAGFEPSRFSFSFLSYRDFRVCHNKVACDGTRAAAPRVECRSRTMDPTLRRVNLATSDTVRRATRHLRDPALRKQGALQPKPRAVCARLFKHGGTNALPKHHPKEAMHTFRDRRFNRGPRAAG